VIRVNVDLRSLAQTGPVHFIGIGGAGMCALAELVVRSGGAVTGCDLKESLAVRELRNLGAEIFLDHDPAHTEEASAVVVTSAVPVDHPELLRAHERGIPVLKRAQALGAWVSEGRVLAVAGTHGKTTTTAMATEILAAAGLEPTGLVGGRVADWDGNLRFGADGIYVVEADEYDRSFHTLSPDSAVVTNVEADHLDVYGDLEGVRVGFETFLRGVRSGGRIAACADDYGAAALLASAGSGGYSYGLSAGSRLRAVDVHLGPGGTRCRVFEDGVDVGPLSLSLGGIHNLLNALGAAAAARSFEVGWDDVRRGLQGFRGVGRRFELLGEARGITVVDDYAHHPTEIEATLEAARASFPGVRLVAAFQPHLYSRTRDFCDDFGAVLALADVVFVTDIFPAREMPIPGVTGEIVAEAARRVGGRDVRYHAQLEELPEVLARELQEGDLLLTMGAGSIEKLGVAVLAALEVEAHA
jgi:UDP-N-acetylmuramate--alanine ligase